MGGWMVWASKGWVDAGNGNWHQIVSSSRKYKDHHLKDPPPRNHTYHLQHLKWCLRTTLPRLPVARRPPVRRDVTWPRRWKNNSETYRFGIFWRAANSCVAGTDFDPWTVNQIWSPVPCEEISMWYPQKLSMKELSWQAVFTGCGCIYPVYYHHCHHHRHHRHLHCLLLENYRHLEKSNCLKISYDSTFNRLKTI